MQMKRSKIRSNPKLTNHIIYKNLRSRWRKRNHLNKLELFQTRDFTPEMFFKPLELASFDNTSITDACMYYRGKEIPCPSAEEVLLRCREEGADKMAIHVNHALEQQYQDIPGKIRRQFSKQGIIIIDFHTDPYYGTSDNPDVVPILAKRSTTLAYSFLTADVYVSKKKQTIALVHRRRGEAIEDLFWDLMTQVEFLITPKLLIMDGELTTVKIMEELQQRGYSFIGRKRLTNRLRPLALAYSLTDNWEKKRTFRAMRFLDMTKKVETTVHVTFQKIQGQMKGLVISPDLQLTPDEADQLYSLRFNIETGYRDKHCFQGRTTSNNLAIRLVLFLFAIMHWNLWYIFLMTASNGCTGNLTSVGIWRRRLRTIKRLTLRDDLL